MDKGKGSFDVAASHHHLERCRSSSSEKVCLISRVIAKDKGDFSGFHIYVIDLSQLTDDDDGSKRNLEPNVLLDLSIGMSVCGLDSTVYFTGSCVPYKDEKQKVFSLDIETLTYPEGEKSKLLSAADLRTLPPMNGKKRAALLTSIPRSRKILAFSAEYQVIPVLCFDPAFDMLSVRLRNEAFVDFELYDVETDSWEALPMLIIRKTYETNGVFSYFLHGPGTGREGIEIPIDGRDKHFHSYQIARYTFIDKEDDGGVLFLIHLSCGPKLSLDLNSPSKGWRLCNERMVFRPSPERNHFVVREERKVPWCASDVIIGERKFGNAVSLPPLSSFGDEDPVKYYPLAILTSLEVMKSCVCVANGGVSRSTKHPQLLVDVVDLHTEKQVGSTRFEVLRRYKRFVPCCLFVYHPKSATRTDDIMHD